MLMWLVCVQIRPCSVSSLRIDGSEGPEAEVPAGQCTGVQETGLSRSIA